MKSFLKLVRWQNLLIIILTMVCMRYAVIGPFLAKIGVVLINGNGNEVPMELQSSWYDFLLLVIATVSITAGGYVINDYFDIKTDLINKGKVIVGTKIPRRKAMMWHNILNLIGVSAGFYVSYKAGYFWLGAFFLVISGLLYFYSASYKRQFLIGNIIVAVLTTMVPFIVVLYEWPALYKFYIANAVDFPPVSFIFYWVGGFALFAFLTTLTREIIKDIEDFEGDEAYGRNTMPVMLGIVTSKIISITLIAITIILIFLVWHFFISDTITLLYLSVAIVLPLFIVAYKLIKSSNRKQLHDASSIMKIVMLTGILYSIVVKVILKWNLFS
jgi:4-hydroxybenzoate polyprenyltransferase